MRRFLVGSLFLVACVPAIGQQRNTTLLNLGGQMENVQNIHIQISPSDSVSLDRHEQVRDMMIKAQIEADRRKSELEKMARLTGQQKRELDLLKRELGVLKSKLALFENEYRQLQAQYEEARKKGFGQAQMLFDTGPSASSSSNGTSASSSSNGKIDQSSSDANIFALIERSEADRASVSASLAKDSKRLSSILDILIASTESIDDKERAEWRSLLPRMPHDKRLRLFDILSTERFKLADLERKYQKEIHGLNAKHLDEWIEFQRQRLNRHDRAATRDFAAMLVESRQDKYLIEAKGILLETLRNDPTDHMAHYLLARLYAARKQWQDAQDSVAAAIRLAPDNADYHGLQGRIFFGEEKNEKALDAYARAFRLGVRDTSYLRNHGALLLDMKRPDEAVAVLHRLLEISPGNAEAQRLMGVALRDQGRFEAAIGHLRQAIKVDGDNPRHHFSLAWTHYVQHKYAEAERVFGQVAKLDMKNFDAIAMMGLSMVEQGREKDALPVLQKALAIAINLSASKVDEAEIRLGVALLLSDNNRGDEGRSMMADAAANSQGCSASYMKTRRNWHNRMLGILGKWRESLCEG